MTESFSQRNRRRCESPTGFHHQFDSWSLSDWMTATTGELGEAANVIKKLNRVRDGIPGNTVSAAELRAQLADELADVAIYLDLLAQAAGFDLETIRDAKFEKKSVEIGYVEPGVEGTFPKPPPKRVADIVKPALALCHPIFRYACDPENPRYSVAAPFLWRDQVVATDGRMLIWQPATPEVIDVLSGVEDRKLPKVDELIDSPPEYESEPISVVLGDAVENCKECDGVVWVVSPNGCRVYDCDSCGSRSVVVGETKIAARFALTLLSQGATVYLPKAKRNETGKWNALRFTVGAVTGFLMPLDLDERTTQKEETPCWPTP